MKKINTPDKITPRLPRQVNSSQKSKSQKYLLDDPEEYDRFTINKGKGRGKKMVKNQGFWGEADPDIVEYEYMLQNDSFEYEYSCYSSDSEEENGWTIEKTLS